jgi:ssDNA-binding Zn-finger/Zn-ribbon topoisomerase 1
VGEYAKYKGQEVKLGTCENMYYITVQEYIKRRTSLTVSFNYLTPNDSLFRFPFPDEDGQAFEFENFYRGVSITIPKTLGVEIYHKEITEIDLKEVDTLTFEIIQQKIVCDESSNEKIELQTVVRCPNCGGVSRLSKEEAESIYNYFKSLKHSLITEEQKEIFERMYKGYTSEYLEFIENAVNEAAAPKTEKAVNEVTAEPKAKKSKKEKIQDLKNWISNVAEEEQKQMLEKVNIKNVQGRELSENNQMLLLGQNENVSIVAGYKQWQADGKQVKKGETALIIFVPSVTKTKDKETEEENEFLNFYPANVFDISQVEEIAPK